MELDDSLDAIEAALDEGDVDGALRLARLARKQFPDEPEVHLIYGHALWDEGELVHARDAYLVAARLAPDSAEVLAAVAWAHLALSEFDAAQRAAEKSNAEQENSDASAILCRLAERAGKMAEADRLAQRAHGLDPDNFPLPFRVSEEEFRQVVSEALDELPDQFRRALDGDVAVLVEPVPPVEVLSSEKPPLDPELLGLYVGVSLPERTPNSSVPGLPDRIYLFQHNLEHEAGDRRELLEQIAITVYHEVGHYFGFDDDQLEELDLG
jgi:predicted Zn-dependent protease with MMP-like domain